MDWHWFIFLMIMLPVFHVWCIGFSTIFGGAGKFGLLVRLWLKRWFVSGNTGRGLFDELYQHLAFEDV